MPYVKRIVCLANSYKPPNGRCVAGREILDDAYGGWVRPVNGASTGEVPQPLCAHLNLLDIVDIHLSNHAPQGHQTENHIFDPQHQWTKRGKLAFGDLKKLCEQPTTLWVNSDKTALGTFDCISRSEAASLNTSLLLIRQARFTLQIGPHPFDANKNKKSYRGIFNYNGTPYNLSVTDPVARAKPDGYLTLSDVYLCTSLTEPYQKDGRCHKLVAAIFCEQAI